MARKIKGHLRHFDASKTSAEVKEIMISEGLSVIEELAKRLAAQANIFSQRVQLKEESVQVPGQPHRRGPDKSGSSSSGPIAGSIVAQPGHVISNSWLVVSPAWYSHFVEYGTIPHRMPKGSKRGNMMVFPGTNKYAGKIIGTKNVNHPGVSTPQPFMRPAADMADQIAREILSERGLLKVG